MSNRIWLFCSHFSVHEVRCCNSCHDDCDEGYGPMLQFERDDLAEDRKPKTDFVLEICCAVADNIPLTRSTLARALRAKRKMTNDSLPEAGTHAL